MVVANAPVPANAPHVHAEAIKAWADGYEIERYIEDINVWYTTNFPSWDVKDQYRIKIKPPVNKVMFAKIEIGGCSGLWFFDVLPDEANCKLVFDGSTNELLDTEVIKPKEAPKRPSDASNNHSQWLGSLNQFKRTGEL